VSAAAKLNLSLRIVGRRSDGYHLLDSAVVPIAIFDRLDVDLAPADPPGVSLICRPEGASPPGEDNLASRAALAFLRTTGIDVGVRIELEKRIPSGAGLGGGSSDAAAVLRALNAMTGWPLRGAPLTALALELGADVPFFLFGRPARMRGIGEELDAWTPPFDCPLVVVFPGVGLSTRNIYAGYDDSLTTNRPLSKIRGLTVGHVPLRSIFVNDLEAAAFRVQPALWKVKERLRALGAEGTLMTGSGSAVFGVWQHWDDARAAAERLRAGGLWAQATEMLQRVPAVEMEC
jgi:4-diphosphocytidyl-2-C-methyl-D-erythritol kinase